MGAMGGWPDKMKITVVYCFPTHPAYYDAACRFLLSYDQYPAGIDHSLVIVSNGGPPSKEMRGVIDLFDHPVELYQHDNSGYDIGAYQAVARVKAHDDMIVFFGATAYIRGANWLKRMAEAFERHGPTCLYGCMGNNGDVPIGVWPHIRTTGFWLAPMMMNMYPMRVLHANQRYEFEHGRTCLTSWFREHGHRALMVTWNGECDWPGWNSIPNGFHRGDQSQLLTGDKISAPPFYPCP